MGIAACHYQVHFGFRSQWQLAARYKQLIVCGQGWGQALSWATLGQTNFVDIEAGIGPKSPYVPLVWEGQLFAVHHDVHPATFEFWCLCMYWFLPCGRDLFIKQVDCSPVFFPRSHQRRLGLPDVSEMSLVCLYSVVSPAWHGFLVRMQQLDIALFALRDSPDGPISLGTVMARRRTKSRGLWDFIIISAGDSAGLSNLRAKQAALPFCTGSCAHANPSMAMSAAWRGRGGCCMRNRGWQHRATQHV